MKTINRRAITALVFGFLSLSGGASFAKEAAKEHACRAARNCRGPQCCFGQSQRVSSASNQMNERYKAKYGREYPGTRPAGDNKAASAECRKNCCC